MSRLRGSATALKASDVVAALATGGIIHADIGMCQALISTIAKHRVLARRASKRNTERQSGDSPNALSVLNVFLALSYSPPCHIIYRRFPFSPLLSSTASDRDAASCGTAVFCFAVAPVQVWAPADFKAEEAKCTSRHTPRDRASHERVANRSGRVQRTPENPQRATNHRHSVVFVECLRPTAIQEDGGSSPSSAGFALCLRGGWMGTYSIRIFLRKIARPSWMYRMRFGLGTMKWLPSNAKTLNSSSSFVNGVLLMSKDR